MSVNHLSLTNYNFLKYTKNFAHFIIFPHRRSMKLPARSIEKKKENQNLVKYFFISFDYIQLSVINYSFSRWFASHTHTVRLFSLKQTIGKYKTQSFLFWHQSYLVVEVGKSHQMIDWYFDMSNGEWELIITISISYTFFSFVREFLT